MDPRKLFLKNPFKKDTEINKEKEKEKVKEKEIEKEKEKESEASTRPTLTSVASSLKLTTSNITKNLSNIHITKNDKETPLHAAITFRNVAFILKQIETPESAEPLDLTTPFKGKTPLERLLELAKSDAAFHSPIELLLKKLNEKDNRHILSKAVKNAMLTGNTSLLMTLVPYIHPILPEYAVYPKDTKTHWHYDGEDQTGKNLQRGDNVLHYAVRFDDMALAKLVLERDKRLGYYPRNESKKLPLEIAIENSSFENRSLIAPLIYQITCAVTPNDLPELSNELMTFIAKNGFASYQAYVDFLRTPFTDKQEKEKEIDPALSKLSSSDTSVSEKPKDPIKQEKEKVPEAEIEIRDTPPNTPTSSAITLTPRSGTGALFSDSVEEKIKEPEETAGSRLSMSRNST